VCPNVVVVGSLPDEVLARLSADVALAVVANGPALRAMAARDELQDVQGLLVTGQAPVDAEILDAAPALRVVSLRAVGYDRVDVASCSRRGIQVCTTPGVLEGAVADLTLLLMLALARRIREAVAVMEDPGASLPSLGTDLRGATLGVVGMGRIGRQVAASAHHGFGMHVLYTARGTRTEPVGRQTSLHDLLRASDVVTLHLPMSGETAGVIGRRELALMRRTAFLVDTARPGLIDLEALEDSLASGDIAGAALDMPFHEYPPAASRLRQLPQLLLTPHIGSATEGTRRAMADMAADNLLRVLQGQPALSCVNPEAGAGDARATHAGA
jgi:glyoxylate reductase